MIKPCSNLVWTAPIRGLAVWQVMDLQCLAPGASYRACSFQKDQTRYHDGWRPVIRYAIFGCVHEPAEAL